MSMSRNKKIAVIALLVLAAGAALLLWVKRGDWFGAGRETVSEQAQERDYQRELPEFAPLPAQNATNATSAAPANATIQEKEDGFKPGDLVTPRFILDLARYAVSNYHPAGTRHNDRKSGIATLSFKKLNMRYGVNLTGLDVDARDVDKARSTVFELILNPVVLNAIYKFYADDFVDALIQEGRTQTRSFRTKGGGFEERPMEPGQVREMLALYAKMAGDTAMVFRSFSSNPGLVQTMADYFASVARVHAAYEEFAALEAQGRTGEALSRVSVEIRDAIMAREALKSEILKKTTPSERSFGLSDGEVMDIASWIYRRVSNDAGRLSSIGSIATIFLDFSGELEDAAKSLIS